MPIQSTGTGSFGFQIMGGCETDMPATIEFIVPGRRQHCMHNSAVMHLYYWEVCDGLRMQEWIPHSMHTRTHTRTDTHTHTHMHMHTHMHTHQAETLLALALRR